MNNNFNLILKKGVSVLCSEHYDILIDAYKKIAWSNNCEKNSYLFPENSKHPKSQLIYCQEIINNLNEDSQFLICTYSPYILQALDVYSQKQKKAGLINFYSVNKEGDVNEEGEEREQIENVNDNLGILFGHLADPMNEIVWTDEDDF